MATQYISKRSLLDLCEATERDQGARLGMRWWEQSGIGMEGSSETVAAAEEADKDGMEE